MAPGGMTREELTEEYEKAMRAAVFSLFDDDQAAFFDNAPATRAPPPDRWSAAGPADSSTFLKGWSIFHHDAYPAGHPEQGEWGPGWRKRDSPASWATSASVHSSNYSSNHSSSRSSDSKAQGYSDMPAGPAPALHRDPAEFAPAPGLWAEGTDIPSQDAPGWGPCGDSLTCEIWRMKEETEDGSAGPPRQPPRRRPQAAKAAEEASQDPEDGLLEILRSILGQGNRGANKVRPEEHPKLFEKLEQVLPRNEVGEITSIGSIPHAGGHFCQPCAFHMKAKGCYDGVLCTFCHFHTGHSCAPKKTKKEPLRRARILR